MCSVSYMISTVFPKRFLIRDPGLKSSRLFLKLVLFTSVHFIFQLEAAYDTLLMQSLSQRRRGKVLDNSIRFADVRKAKAAAGGGGPIWLKEALKNSPVAVQTPPVNDIGLQTGVYSALILLTFATGLQPSTQMAIQSGADTPGFILAIGFGASLYFLRKQNVKLGTYIAAMFSAHCQCHVSVVLGNGCF